MSENGCFMRNLRFGNVEVENSTKFEQDIKINDYHLKVTDGEEGNIYKAKLDGNNIWGEDISNITIESYTNITERDNATKDGAPLPIGTLALIDENDALFFKKGENLWKEINTSNTLNKVVIIKKKAATATIAFASGINTYITGKYIELINKSGEPIRFQEASEVGIPAVSPDNISYFISDGSDLDVITLLKTKINNTTYFSATSESLTITVTQIKDPDDLAYINLNNSTDIETNITLGKFRISQQLLTEGLKGHYTADSFTSYNNWGDLSGSGNHMISGSGAGIKKLAYPTTPSSNQDGFSRNFNSDPTYNPYITNAVIGSSYNDNRGHGHYEFPDEIRDLMKTSNYTFIHLAKYHNESKSYYLHRTKIFNDSDDGNGTNGNWCSGFGGNTHGNATNGIRGIVKHNKTGGGYVTFDMSADLDPLADRTNQRVINGDWSSYPTNTKSHNWLLTVDQADRVRFNAKHDSILQPGGNPMEGGVGITGDLRINSNSNGGGPNSHWMIEFMAFWNRKLSTEEIKDVENHIINTYGLTF